MSRSLMATVALSLLGLAGSSHGTDPPRSREPVRLDTKALGAMITDLGYEPKVQQDTSYNFQAKGKEKTAPVWVSLNGDRRHIRLFTEFALRPGYDKAPAETWRKIMEKNYDLAPSYFGLDEKGARLTLHHEIPNANITPMALRKEITVFVELVWQHQDLWAAANFLPALSDEARRVLNRMHGTWKVETLTTMGNPGAPEAIGAFTFTFEKNQLVVAQNGKEALRTGVQLVVRDGSTTIDLVTATGASELGVMKFEGDALTICTGPTGGPRATKFESTAKGKETLLVLKRVKP